METFLQDLRFGFRTLGRNPGFALVAVITLALGVGANAAIFSVVNAVLLRPLPWSDPDRVVMIWSRWTAFDKTWVSDGEVNDYRRRASSFAEVAAQDGRTFAAGEDVPNGPRLVVLGHGLWQRRYAGDPGIIGRSIQINGAPYQVIGIMPRDFVLPTDFQNPAPTMLWTAQQWDASSTDHGSHGFYAAARLKPGTTVAQAREEMHRVAQAMTAEGLYPRPMQFDTVVLSLRDEVLGTVRRAIWLL